MYNEPKHGIFKGKVVNANDPENRGRVKALIPAVLKDQVSNWCDPLVRTVTKPKVNDIVYVQFVDGDIAQPVFSLPPGVRRDIDKVQKQLDNHDHPHSH